MASSIIDKTRNAVEVFAGLARIGAGMVKARARTAIGIPTLLDCDACGGTDYTMRVRDGHRVCISCVEVEREDAESARARDASHLDDADAKLSAMRKALTMAGVPESEPYPDDAVSDWERSLRTGGYMIGGVTRIQRLATERDAARTELAKVTAERDDARSRRRWSHGSGVGRSGGVVTTIPACVAPWARDAIEERLDQAADAWLHVTLEDSVLDLVPMSDAQVGRVVESALHDLSLGRLPRTIEG